MQETINFLSVLDVNKKKSFTINHSTSKDHYNKNHGVNVSHGSSSHGSSSHRKNKFPFFRALNFKEQKFQDYPKWLTNREDFMQFMYKKYQAKLLTIPKICSKKIRASDQKYFISLYLQQIQIFDNTPSFIMDIILSEIQSKTFQPGQTIHFQQKQMPFMGILFVGSVQYKKAGKLLIRNRNEVIMNEAFYKSYHPTIIAKQETVVLIIKKQMYKKIQALLKADIYQKSRDQIADMLKSDFFVELHIKEKKAKSFYDNLTPQFYFKNQIICEAGQTPKNFYIHFKGQILQKNHIYIRQHNKWPLPNRRWEVRAVYNSYQNQSMMKQSSFFGDQQIIGNLKFKSTYVAKSFCILYSMNAQVFKSSLNGEDFKRLKKYRNEHVDVNYGEFQDKVRQKVQSQVQRKKIIHKAIDTSFAHKTYMTPKKMSLINSFQSTMLTKSFTQNVQQQKNKFF